MGALFIMRIAFFTNNYLPNTGGAAISVETYRSALEKLGHEVYVFAPKYPRWFPAYNDGDRIFRYPALFIKQITIHPIPIPFSFLIENYFRDKNFNIIHSHHPYIVGKTALRLSKKYNIPIVFTYHTLYHKYVHYIPLIPQKIKEWFAIKSSVDYANKTNLVIAPSAEVKEMIKNFGVKTKIEVLPTGIDFSLWEREIPDKFKYDPRWFGKKILLYAGRLAKEKNLDFLLRSLTPLLKEREDVILLIVGGGDERDNLINLAKRLEILDKALFLGWYPREKLVYFYKIADIFVFSSTTETQGLVTLEAMAGGCAVVAVRATGSESLVTHGIEGFLVNEDEEEFREYVKILLSNKDLLEKMKKNAQIKSKEFSIEKNAKKLEELYYSLLK